MQYGNCNVNSLMTTVRIGNEDTIIVSDDYMQSRLYFNNVIHRMVDQYTVLQMKEIVHNYIFSYREVMSTYFS